MFDVACDMVRQSPALSKRIKIVPSTKRMVYVPTGSIYQVLSSEVATKHGLNVSACIFDELHTQPTRALYDVMTQGSGDARRQPLWFFLTTAGTDRTSICWEVHQKALDLLEGRKKDDRFYPVIYGLAESEDWHKEENWYKANPSLGYTITIDKVRDAFHKALETPADENMFRQLRLNQWTAQSVRWMPMDKWDECGGYVSEYDLEGRACYGGLDLSSTSDLTTLVLVFPPLDEYYGAKVHLLAFLYRKQATPLHASAPCRALTGCCLFRITNAACRPRLALSRAYRPRATKWLVIRRGHDRGNCGGKRAKALFISWKEPLVIWGCHIDG